MIGLLCAMAWGADGVEVRTVAHLGVSYRVATVDLRMADLELYGQTPGYGDFQTLAELRDWLRTEGREMVVATNAGIFLEGYRPLGLHIERGAERGTLNLGDGHGNFYLKPNGVFFVDATGAHVVTSEAWTWGATLATQSGPMLVVDGEIHPAFREGSSNLTLRSGVGVSDPHTVHLAISQGATRLHDFATLFRDVLGCDDALYLDGTISEMLDPENPAASGRYAGLLVVTQPLPAGETTTWAPPRYPQIGRNVGPGAPFLGFDGEDWDAGAGLKQALRRQGIKARVSGDTLTWRSGDMEITQVLGPSGTARLSIHWADADPREIRARLEQAFGPPVPAEPGPGRLTLEAGAGVTVTWTAPR